MLVKIFLGILIFILSCLVHEVGHLLVLLITKIGVKEICFMFFTVSCDNFVIRLNDRVSPTIHIIPKVVDILDEASYLDYKARYVVSLAFGPLFSLLLVLGFLCLNNIFPAYYIIGVALNIFIFLSTLIDNRFGTGDVYAIYKILTHEDYLFSYLIEFYEYDSKAINQEQTLYFISKGFSIISQFYNSNSTNYDYTSVSIIEEKANSLIKDGYCNANDKCY